MITHTFNAMKGIHHRNPGPIGEALKHGKISFGLIADGIHVQKEIAVFLHKLTKEKLVLVSDALAPYGLSTNKHTWDERELYIREGTCHLNDGTLAGTTLPLLEGCKRLASWSTAIWAATMAPRQVLKGKSTIQDQLLGKPLNQLLRWKSNSKEGDLTWQHAT